MKKISNKILIITVAIILLLDVVFLAYIAIKTKDVEDVPQIHINGKSVTYDQVEDSSTTSLKVKMSVNDSIVEVVTDL